jgi:acyl-CoA dehydrogenase
MTGALERALELTLRYVGERRQFGRPIGQFQAVQQQVSVFASEVAAAVMAFEAVAAALDGDLFEVEVAIGKARIGEAAGAATAIAHQVHGAMGFTQEYPLHQATRRLWSWRDAFGNETDWQVVLGRFACSSGSAGTWHAITRRTI